MWLRTERAIVLEFGVYGYFYLRLVSQAAALPKLGEATHWAAAWKEKPSSLFVPHLLANKTALLLNG